MQRTRRPHSSTGHTARPETRQFRLAAKRFSNLLSRAHSSAYIRHVIADEETRQAVQALIKTTYDAMSTPGPV